MKENLTDEIRKYVVANIGNFHADRLANLNKLKLKKILGRKNPYLFKAKHQETAADIVKVILDSYLSSSEETIFGDWLEGLAIFIAGQVYGGTKSSARGIDLEFDNDGIHYIVSIKSGPNWGNSGQIKKMKDDFKTAMRILHTGKQKMHVVAVNGCCYGKNAQPDKGDYQKLCGQDFWAFVSGDEDLYLKIIEPLAAKAKERNEAFAKEYSCKLNLFIGEFLKEFCKTDGSVDWEKIVTLNSGARNKRKSA